jgi:hypothetical protein
MPVAAVPLDRNCEAGTCLVSFRASSRASGAAGEGGDVPAGTPFTHEIVFELSTDDAMREIVLDDVPGFERLGYRLESRTTDALVLRRRYLPTKAFAIPLTLAGFFAVVCALRGGQMLFALPTLMFLLVALLLALIVRVKERITITLTTEGAGSRALVSGQATAAMRDRLRALNGSRAQSSV